MQFAFNLFISAVTISFASWLSGRFPTAAGFVVALPLATMLVLPLSYNEHGNAENTILLAKSILVAIPISLAFFVPFLLSGRFARLLAALPAPSRRAAAGAGTLALVASLAGYIAAHERQPYNPNGPWAELAALFEATADEPFDTAGVLTPNPHAFQLTTGHSAPMRVADASFDHMVARNDGVGPQPPAGSRPLLEVAPWVLYELPRRTSGADLTGGPPRYPMEW